MGNRVRLVVRRLNPTSADEIELVAQRMRQTLEEVLDPERGRSMYSMDWLRGRVRQHLEPDVGEVFLAVMNDAIVGHAIVRNERDDQGRLGLFSTVWVHPDRRRSGVARALLKAGHGWLRRAGNQRFATNTDSENRRLIGLFMHHGYQVTERAGGMVQLTLSEH